MRSFRPGRSLGATIGAIVALLAVFIDHGAAASPDPGAAAPDDRGAAVSDPVPPRTSDPQAPARRNRARAKEPAPSSSGSAGSAAARTTSSGSSELEAIALANGLQVVLLPAHSNPMVASTVLVRSGVIDETAATSGASHFLEHLLFNGTERRTQKQLYEDADQIGGYNNATTREEYTLFQFLVHRERLAAALDIQSDMLLHSTIPAGVFEKERGIVLEEMAREESDPAYGAEQFFRRCWFGSDPRSMPVLGTTASIGAMTREQVLAHYRRLYRPERMVLFLAGDFARDETLALVRKSFGAGDGAKSARAKDPWESGSKSKRGRPLPGVYRRRIAGDRAFLRIGFPAPGVGDPDAAAIGAAAEMLGGRPGTRLARTLAGEEGSIAISASAAYVAGPGPGGGRLVIEAILPASSDGSAAIKAIVGEVRRLASEPASRDELRTVVAAEKTSSLYLRDQIHYLGMAVAPDLIFGSRPSLGIGASELSALTPEIVQSAVRRWLLGEPVAALSSPAVPEGVDPTVAAPLPPSASMSEEAAARGPGGQLGHEDAGGATDRPAGARPMVERVVFDNGLVLLVAESAESPIFAAHLLVRDRAALEPSGQDGMADLLHRVLPYGSLLLDGDALAAKLGAIGARLKTVDDPDVPYDDYYMSPRYSFVRFETISENWREGIGLLYTTVVFPRLTDRDIALALSEEIDLARKAADAPAARARQLYTKMVGDGPLARPVTGTPATLASIRPADLRAFHTRYFAPENLVLSIVSDVRRSEVIELVRATFGAMPKGPASARETAGVPGAAGSSGAAPPPGVDRPAEHPVDRPESDAEAARRPARTSRPSPLPGEAPPPEAPPRAPSAPALDPPVTEKPGRVEIAAGKEQSQILLGGIFARDPADLAPLIVATTVLSKRVAQDLRETRGLAYAVGCSFEDYGSKGWFTASMGTRPENVDIAEAGLREAIQRFPDAPLEAREIERAVNAMRGQMAMRRMTRISQAYSLGFNELLGRSTTFDATLDAALGAVTAADVQRVARRYLDPSRMISAIAR